MVKRGGKRVYKSPAVLQNRLLMLKKKIIKFVVLL